METHFKIAGALMIVLGLIHAAFPKYFNWKTDLQTLSLINRQMMRVHTFFIALTVFLSGILCVSSASELTHTKLGARVTLGFGIFWTVRLIFQLFVYSPKLWLGKKTETVIHVIFILLWSYFSCIFLGTALCW